MPLEAEPETLTGVLVAVILILGLAGIGTLICYKRHRSKKSPWISTSVTDLRYGWGLPGSLLRTSLGCPLSTASTGFRGIMEVTQGQDSRSRCKDFFSLLIAKSVSPELGLQGSPVLRALF